MSKISDKKVSDILEAVEKMIDARYEYLQEKNYENHYHSRKVLEEKYNPCKEILEQLLKDI
jgi:hypothetical protein